MVFHSCLRHARGVEAQSETMQRRLFQHLEYQVVCAKRIIDFSGSLTIERTGLSKLSLKLSRHCSNQSPGHTDESVGFYS